MKTNAIIRIVIFSIVILVLLALLASIFLVDALLVRNVSMQGGNSVIVEEVDGNKFTSSANVSASEINDLQIEWVAGTISIIPTDTDRITFSERGATDESELMVWKQSGDKLIIQYSEENWKSAGFSIGINMDYSKDLEVTVPNDWVCNELDIDSISTNVCIDNLTINELDLDTVSGYCDLDNCTVGDLALDTVSGDIIFVGSLDTLECSAVSANCTIEVVNIPKRIEMDGVSGDLELSIPPECGFTASVDTASGDFTSDFNTVTQNGSYLYGNGSCRISMEGVSGDITIQQIDIAR